jgi:hypothetical protein
MLNSDGDIVRGLGFVALFAAYLEEQIENLRNMLGTVEAVTEREYKWPISKKIDKIKFILQIFEFETRDELIACLVGCEQLFEQRNEVIHGRIYASFDREDSLKSGRPFVPERQVKAQELYDLANNLEAMRGEIIRPMLFKIPRAMAGRK